VKKPQSVHATYLISGIQNPPEPPATNGHANDEDEIMQSSPYLPSSMPNQEVVSDPVRIASVILARDEDLEGALLHPKAGGIALLTTRASE
jgi:DNA polymerase delta subunit 3